MVLGGQCKHFGLCRFGQVVFQRLRLAQVNHILGQPIDDRRLSGQVHGLSF